MVLLLLLPLGHLLFLLIDEVLEVVLVERKVGEEIFREPIEKLNGIYRR